MTFFVFELNMNINIVNSIIFKLVHLIKSNIYKFFFFFDKSKEILGYLNSDFYGMAKNGSGVFIIL